MSTPSLNVSDEYYTPKYIIEVVTEFADSIDLDPFSCAKANETVNATVFWSREDNALEFDWTKPIQNLAAESGKRNPTLWLNPPYSRRLMPKCVAKALFYRFITQQTWLVPPNTNSSWFRILIRNADAICCPDKRIPFFNPYKECNNANMHNSIIVYIGDRSSEFVDVFTDLGTTALILDTSWKREDVVND